MGIRPKILLAFALACAVIIAFTLAVIRLQLLTVDRGVHLETLNLARSVAYGAALGNQNLQKFVSGLDELYKRDIVIVDADQKGVADSDYQEVGLIYGHDEGDEVGLTIRDGQARTFVETNALHPEGVDLIAVPIFRGGRAGAPVVGAVIVEFTQIRRELLRSAIGPIYGVAGAGALCVLIVGWFGYRFAGSVSASAQQISYLAYHDKLTGLHNRSKFSSTLERGLTEAARHDRRLAVFFVDLDRFKNINDTLGHQAGDLLLQEAARRLTACLREGDSVARLGGDEFVVMLPDANSSEQLTAVAQRMLMELARSMTIQGQEFHVTASIGISVYPVDGDDERALMKNADIAMYQAKEDGKNGFAFYSEALNQNSVERLAFESSLRRGLEERQFEVHYQPKVGCQSGRVTGVEALLRWQHPDLGPVSPVKFIPIAEETGLIVPIGRWVLKTACEQHMTWRRQGLPPMHIAVNLSARQFYDEQLLGDVTGILAETGVDPACLELEITESMLMRNVEKAGQVLAAFKALGIRLSVDDFGTGYSSLSNLKLFPIDTIKIDRSFIRDLPACVEDKAIAEAIIAMGKTLGMTVVAEGVETFEQAAFLRDHGCDQFQGFYFSKAVSPADVVALLERETSAASFRASDDDGAPGEPAQSLATTAIDPG